MPQCKNISILLWKISFPHYVPDCGVTGASNLHRGLSEVSQWQQPSRWFFALFWRLTVWEHRRAFGEALRLRQRVRVLPRRVITDRRRCAAERCGVWSRSELTFPADTLGAFRGAVVLLPLAVSDSSDDQNTLTLEPGSRLQLAHSVKKNNL